MLPSIGTVSTTTRRLRRPRTASAVISRTRALAGSDSAWDFSSGGAIRRSKARAPLQTRIPPGWRHLLQSGFQASRRQPLALRRPGNAGRLGAGFRALRQALHGRGSAETRAHLQGARAFVTDAQAPSFLAPLVGGGSTVCPAFCNGAAWVAA